MKMILKSLLAAGLLSAATAAQASIVSINFNNTGSGPNAGVGASDSAGAVTAVNWNNIAAGAQNQTATPGLPNGLKDNSGSSTGMQVAWSDPDNRSPAGSLWNYVSGNGNAEFMSSGTVDVSKFHSATITLTNIPYSSYSILVYTGDQSAGGYNDEVQVSGSSVAYWNYNQGNLTNTGAGSATLVKSTDTVGNSTTASNYVQWDNLTGATKTITTGHDTNGGFSFVTGIQIVQATVVPEPVSMSLLGMTSVSLLMRRRSNKSGH